MERLYHKRIFQNRLFFVPEANQDLGPSELYDTVAALILSMLDPDEHQRPNPSWTHLLFKRLSVMAQK